MQLPYVESQVPRLLHGLLTPPGQRIEQSGPAQPLLHLQVPLPLTPKSQVPLLEHKNPLELNGQERIQLVPQVDVLQLLQLEPFQKPTEELLKHRQPPTLKAPSWQTPWPLHRWVEELPNGHSIEQSDAPHPGSQVQTPDPSFPELQTPWPLQARPELVIPTHLLKQLGP